MTQHPNARLAPRGRESRYKAVVGRGDRMSPLLACRRSANLTPPPDHGVKQWPFPIGRVFQVPGAFSLAFVFIGAMERASWACSSTSRGATASATPAAFVSAQTSTLYMSEPISRNDRAKKGRRSYERYGQSQDPLRCSRYIAGEDSPVSRRGRTPRSGSCCRYARCGSFPRAYPFGIRGAPIWLHSCASALGFRRPWQLSRGGFRRHFVVCNRSRACSGYGGAGQVLS